MTHKHAESNVKIWRRETYVSERVTNAVRHTTRSC